MAGNSSREADRIFPEKPIRDEIYRVVYNVRVDEEVVYGGFKCNEHKTETRVSEFATEAKARERHEGLTKSWSDGDGTVLSSTLQENLRADGYAPFWVDLRRASLHEHEQVKNNS